MDTWNKWLASLATRGGAIFMLAVVFGVSVGVELHLIHHGESGSQEAASLTTMLSGFAGAFLVALKGSSDSTATVTGPGGTASASTAPTAPSTEGTQAVAQATK